MTQEYKQSKSKYKEKTPPSLAKIDTTI